MKKFSILTVVLLCVGVGAGAYFASESEHQSTSVNASERVNRRAEAATGSESSGVHVEVIKPHRGGIERTTSQPGTVMSFESARLYSKVSGYLKTQELDGEPVDIGTQVKKGDVLAVIDMPETEKEVQRDLAEIEQAKARIVQAKAHIESAKADYEAANALIGERKADVDHAKATLSYRQKQYDRFRELYKQNGVEERVVDEAEDNRDAARAGLSSANASVVSAQAAATASKAKIDQAEADLVDAKAKLEVAKATLDKDKVFLEYTKIRSPYDGVVTFRGFFPGEFINARDQGATIPLLTVDRTDKMRVVLQVPDLDVPFVNPGDEAVIKIVALPDKEFPGKVARVSNSEDPQTKTMRTEVDLDNVELSNGDKLLRDGMYGNVTITLDKPSESLTVPSDALVGESESGKGSLYVVRSGKAHKIEVRLGADDGLNTEILSGLNPDDEVAVHPRGAIGNGVPVTVTKTK